MPSWPCSPLARGLAPWRQRRIASFCSRFNSRPGRRFFPWRGSAGLGVALVAVLGQGAAVGFLVADLGQAPGRVVAVVAAGAVGAFDLDEAPGSVVAELGAALAAVQALQAAACVPAGLEGVFALAGKACDELRALAGCISTTIYIHIAYRTNQQ